MGLKTFRWEIGHAVHFILDLFGFSALTVSMLTEIPEAGVSAQSTTDSPEQPLPVRRAS